MSAHCSSKQIQYGIRQSTLAGTRSSVCVSVCVRSQKIAYVGARVRFHRVPHEHVCIQVSEWTSVFTLQSESLPQTSRVCSQRRSPSSYCAAPCGPSALQARWTARGPWSWSCSRSSGPLGLTCPGEEGQGKYLHKAKYGVKKRNMLQNTKVLFPSDLT